MKNTPKALRPKGEHWPWRDENNASYSASGCTISVIVPTYNHGEYIEETIRSICLQDYDQIQLIVIDGGSQDETCNILEHYDAVIDYWVSEPDRGQTDAINKGLDKATGDIIAYLNSDDIYYPNTIRAVAEIAENNPTAALIYGRCRFIDESSQIIGERTANIFTLADILDLWEVWWKEQNLVQPEAFWRAEITKDIGYFNTNLFFVMDYEYWLRILAAGGRCHRIDQHLAGFRFLENQKSADSDGAARELLEVTGDWLWRSGLRIPFLTRKQLQGDWIHNTRYRDLINDCVTQGVRPETRWLKVFWLAMTHPTLMISRLFWRRIALFLNR